MKTPARPLRQRLVAAIAGLGIGVTLLFSAGLYVAFETAEDTLFDTYRARDIQSLLALYERDPALAEVPHENFRVFHVDDDERSTLPGYLQGFDPAGDELVLDGREFHVEVHRRGASTFYFLLDESAFEDFERALFVVTAGLAAGMVGLSVWLSGHLSRRVIRPLTVLSDEVATLADGATVAAPAPHEPSDEVGTLRSAIAGYQARIVAVLEREREFSADVSHELRTPLMGVQGAAELLERRVGSAPALRALATRIRRGCRHMTALTEALLYLAREPASFHDLVETIDIVRVVEAQVATVADITQRKGITVSVERDGTPVPLAAIPAVVEIVIGNIIKNAVKYTDGDVINVIVRPHGVLVQDYGPGIDAATQDRLFERFARGGQRDADGSGIGLALVKRFCDQYGWRIGFDSVPGRGTRIAIDF